MTTINLSQGEGLGTYKMVTGTASLADGGTLTAKFANIVSVQLTAVSSTSGNYTITFIKSVSGSVVTVGIYGAASGSAPAAITSAITIHYTIVGY
jgi:hypothetical protein